MGLLGAIAFLVSPLLLALGSAVDRGLDSVTACTQKVASAQTGKAKAGKKGKPRVERRYMLM
jgi:hypothetical protein